MRPSRAEYERILDQLEKLLRKKTHTAKEIAAAMKCSKPVAYERIVDLKMRDIVVYVELVRESATGPKSIAYGVK